MQCTRQTHAEEKRLHFQVESATRNPEYQAIQRQALQSTKLSFTYHMRVLDCCLCLAQETAPGNEIFLMSPVGDFMMSASVPSAYVTWLSFVAKDMVSLFTFCSSPPPIPKATAYAMGKAQSLGLRTEAIWHLLIELDGAHTCLDACTFDAGREASY